MAESDSCNITIKSLQLDVCHLTCGRTEGVSNLMQFYCYMTFEYGNNEEQGILRGLINNAGPVAQSV